MSMHYGTFDIIVTNAAAEMSKNEQEKCTTVHVRQVSKESIYVWEMVVGDSKVADIRENTERNDSLGCAPQPNTWYPKPPKRRVLDIKVAEGFDTSLVSSIVYLHYVVCLRSASRHWLQLFSCTYCIALLRHPPSHYI